jgi:hypothetical protein
MDDITPIREQQDVQVALPFHLYPVSDHTRFGYNWWLDYVPGGDPGDKKNYFVQNMRPGLTYYELTFTPVNGERKRKFIDAGDPKPLGAIIYFRLNSEPGEISLTILDQSGKEIRHYTKDEMVLNAGNDGTLNGGLNKFVWDTRMDRVTAVPGRPPTAVAPIVPPGTYTARLTVDGSSQTQDFQVFMSPKEPYSQAEAESKFKFWMDLYNSVEASTQNVIAAKTLKEEVNRKLEAFKAGDASAGKINKAEEQAAVVAGIVDAYEGAYVSTGRTLAEIINLPATILSKMAFLSGILDHSEGPVTENMKTVYAELLEESKAVDAAYKASIDQELPKFEKAVK